MVEITHRVAGEETEQEEGENDNGENDNGENDNGTKTLLSKLCGKLTTYYTAY